MFVYRCQLLKLHSFNKLNKLLKQSKKLVCKHATCEYMLSHPLYYQLVNTSNRLFCTLAFANDTGRQQRFLLEEEGKVPGKV